MSARPTLRTDRLVLRPFSLEDVPEVTRLASEWEVASNTLGIPHPYETRVAEEWISAHPERFESGDAVTLAITLRDGDVLLGSISLGLVPQHARAEMGYWVGRPYWNRGYAGESAIAMLHYGFEVLGLNRILAHHFTRNPASGRVMQKAGMIYEGLLRQHVRSMIGFEDVAAYGLLRSDYEARQQTFETG